MAAETTYIVFAQNLQTGSEFTVPVKAPTGNHQRALQQAREQYPASKFKLHTAYSLSELQDVITNLERWGLLPSKVEPGRLMPKADGAVVRASTQLHQPQQVAQPAVQQAHPARAQYQEPGFGMLPESAPARQPQAVLSAPSQPQPYSFGGHAGPGFAAAPGSAPMRSSQAAQPVAASAPKTTSVIDALRALRAQGRA